MKHQTCVAAANTLDKTREHHNYINHQIGYVNYIYIKTDALALPTLQ